MEELKTFLNVMIEKAESSSSVDDYFYGKLEAYKDILAFIKFKENDR